MMCVSRAPLTLRNVCRSISYLVKGCAVGRLVSEALDEAGGLRMPVGNVRNVRADFSESTRSLPKQQQHSPIQTDIINTLLRVRRRTACVVKAKMCYQCFFFLLLAVGGKRGRKRKL